MAYENYTISQFMNAWFKQDYTDITKEEFDIVYTEYIDTAGLYKTEDFEKLSYIYFLRNRVNSVNIAIDAQLEFLDEFDQPYIEGLEFFKRFGHYISWTGNPVTFVTQLDKIKMREKKYISELEKCVKELKESKEKKEKDKKDYTIKDQRISFVKMLNSLGKCGYRLDRDKTTVEELSLMILQQKEEVAHIKNSK